MQIIFDNLESLKKEIKEVNQKWHFNEDGTPKVKDRHYTNRCILLMISELMEAFEYLRKGGSTLPDSHLPQYPGEAVEMADLFIRILDFIVFNKPHWTFDTDPTVFVHDMDFYAHVCFFLARALDHDHEFNKDYLDVVVASIIGYCIHKNYDLYEIVKAKIEYNRNRADHRLENRMKDGGKKF